jgi:hypothetical protein
VGDDAQGFLVLGPDRQEGSPCLLLWSPDRRPGPRRSDQIRIPLRCASQTKKYRDHPFPHSHTPAVEDELRL